ncbi:MAG: 67 kDa myosin-cross-reactive antigen family protein [Anaerospora sp.]|nr:67 kDa myosin-cross-reactive antigen family protein [Anaerospora sp.]
MGQTETCKAYFVGAGVGSLAAAVYLIRDAHIPGKNITIFEEMNITGGSCDGTGSPEKGYMIRGGRMLISNPQKSVRDEIIEFDRNVRTHAKARLIDGDGKIIDVSSMGFSNKDRIDMLKLTVTPEEDLGTITIEQFFSPSFFKTN